MALINTEQFITTYLDRIIYAENNTNNFQRKIVLPNNSINLMFQFGETVFENSNEKQLPLDNSVICGQITKAKEYTCPPGSKTILIKFKPWTAGLFIAADLHEFIDQNISLSNLPNRQFTTQVIEQILSVSKKQIAIDFRQQKFNDIKIDKSILYAINIIYETKGLIKVDELSYKVFNSKRNFERKFKAVTGLPPKKFISNVRFQNCLQFLHANKDLKDIAFDCGFYDQSHFINEFKFITGFTTDNISSKICRIFPTKSIFIASSLQYTGLSGV